MRIRARSQESDPKEFDQIFSELPKNVRREPYTQGLPDPSRWLNFLRAPFLTKEFFILEVEGKVVARCGASLSLVRPGVGYLGFFDTDLAYDSQPVFAAAFDWLKSQGASEIFGPVDFNTWFSYRLSESMQGGRVHAWEPYNPPEYVTIFSKAGFEKNESYASHGIRGRNRFEVGIAHAFTWLKYRKVKKAGFQFREIDRDSLLTREIPIMYAISMAAFKDNHLFEPIPLEVFRGLYAEVAGRLDFSISRYVMDSAGKEIGFMFSFVDGDEAVMKSIAILPEYRGQHLSTALAHLHSRQMLQRGILTAVSALIKDGNRSAGITRRYLNLGSGNWEHTYGLYKLKLTK